MTGSNQDIDHLRLLSIFHYVVGGLTALFSCLPIFHLVLGLVFLLNPRLFHDGGGAPPPALTSLMGLMFVGVAGLAILFGWTLAVVIIYAGRCLAQHRRHLFCTVVAAISCLLFPLGTALGVFTLIVLMRPSVKVMFQ